MRLVIPAAGCGTRFNCRNTPKCLLPIGRETILSRLLRQANSLKIDEVVVVVGFERFQIENFIDRCKPQYSFSSISTTYNPMYADSNSIQSLLCGLGQVCEGRDTLVVDSDVILDEGVLQKFLSNVNGSALLIDTLKMHSEIDMKAQVLRGCIVDLSKTLPLEATTGEFFGVSFFPDSEAKKLSRCCDELISSGGSQLWYEDQGNRTLDAGKMFDKSFDHRVIP